MAAENAPETAVPIGLLASRDFLFITRICDTARVLGLKVETVPEAAGILQKLASSTVGLLLVDLDQCAEVLTHLPAFRAQQAGLQIIAYGSHVETALLKQAREAGCDLVLPRSRFTTQLAELLQQSLRDSSPQE